MHSMTRPGFLDNSLIIGAHPDDELLWFTSILKDVDEVIIIYRDFWAHPELGAKRQAVIEDYPRQNVECLNFEEAGTYGCADWSNPQCDENGLVFSLEASKREFKRLARKTLSTVVPFGQKPPSTSVQAAYRENRHKIHDALKPRLRADMNVFSHNPWGEYGHEDHVQVFRVLDQLRSEIGFKLWMSNYCTERTIPLTMRYMTKSPSPAVRLPSNKPFADQVAQTYKKHDCWTWDDNWIWPDEECFIEAPAKQADSPQHRYLPPLNLFAIDPPAANHAASPAAAR